MRLILIRRPRIVVIPAVSMRLPPPRCRLSLVQRDGHWRSSTPARANTDNRDKPDSTESPRCWTWPPGGFSGCAIGASRRRTGLRAQPGQALRSGVYPARKITVIPNGLDFSRVSFDPEARERPRGEHGI